MRSLLWVLLLVDGVFVVADEVTLFVTAEGSVTLNTGLTEIKEKVRWKIENDIIAEIDREINTNFVAEKFKGKLKLNEKTGSLTIINPQTTDSQVYELQIKGKEKENKKFNVTVNESVPVTEGANVTLHTGVTQKQKDKLIYQRKFGDQDLNDAVDQNDQTGDITIRNIRRNQIVYYKVDKGSLSLHSIFNINLKGKINTVSVMEGEPIILYTGLYERKGYDLILWKFEGHLIAETNKEDNRFLPHDTSDERFKGRLQPSEQSGTLTIRGSRTTDSGVYHLEMSSSTYSLQRNISVTVSGSDRSGAVSGISGASVGLMIWAVTVLLLQEV